MNKSLIYGTALLGAVPLASCANAVVTPNEYLCDPSVRHKCDSKTCETLTESIIGGFSFDTKTSTLSAALGAGIHEGNASVSMVGDTITATGTLKDEVSGLEVALSLAISKDNKFTATWWTGTNAVTIDMGICQTKP
jgi:hypothetical protein